MKRLPLAAFLALATALAGQSLSDRLREVRIPWEAQIDRGDAPTVRKGIEAFLAAAARPTMASGAPPGTTPKKPTARPWCA